MIVINKKRISIIICCVLIGIFAYSYQFSKMNTTQEKEQTKETTATPVSGKVIVVDAGHGRPDERC